VEIIDRLVDYWRLSIAISASALNVGTRYIRVVRRCNFSAVPRRVPETLDRAGADAAAR